MYSYSYTVYQTVESSLNWNSYILDASVPKSEKPLIQKLTIIYVLDKSWWLMMMIIKRVPVKDDRNIINLSICRDSGGKASGWIKSTQAALSTDIWLLLSNKRVSLREFLLAVGGASAAAARPISRAAGASSLAPCFWAVRERPARVGAALATLRSTAEYSREHCARAARPRAPLPQRDLRARRRALPRVRLRDDRSPGAQRVSLRAHWRLGRRRLLGGQPVHSHECRGGPLRLVLVARPHALRPERALLTG